MEDRDVVARISELADEEHRLERSHEGEGLGPDDLQRLRDLEVELDRCWDLLRQRRARREFGENPNDAEVRSAGTVEGYQQ